MDRKKMILQAEIETATKEGCAYMQHEQLQEALGLFQLAYSKAALVDNMFVKRGCAFNLGAVLIALDNPKKGLELLNKALPPPNSKDDKSNGDLFFNFGLAYEAIQSTDLAAKYYELSLEEYQTESESVALVAEASFKAAQCYMDILDWLPAARAYGIASQKYSQLHDANKEAISLCRQAYCLYHGQRSNDAITVANECMIICQNLNGADTLVELYNDLGLVYTQCHDFCKAAMCFELALPLSRSMSKNKKEADILQNLGAAYNSLGDHQRAIKFHVSAAQLHGSLGNRSSEGQCYANLAFAYSQLKDHEKAGHFYLKTLQASRDSEDTHSEWQALEGLGAVSFNKGNPEMSTQYFREALVVLAKSSEENPAARERINNKLADVISSEAPSEVGFPAYQPGVLPLHQSTHAINPVSVLVNDRPRPPSRQEVLQMQYLRQQRDVLNEQMRKQQSLEQQFFKSKLEKEFMPVALGFGAYDEESDNSLSGKDKDSSAVMVKRSEAELWQKRTRPTTAKGRRKKSFFGYDEVDGEEAAPLKTSIKRHSSHRRSQNYKFKQKRLDKRPLLRLEDHDSEDEWKSKMQEIDSDMSGGEYKERLRPESRLHGGTRGKGVWKDVKHFRRAFKNLVHTALSDDERVRRVHGNRKRNATNAGARPIKETSSQQTRSAEEGSPSKEGDTRVDQFIDMLTEKFSEAVSFMKGTNFQNASDDEVQSSESEERSENEEQNYDTSKPHYAKLNHSLKDDEEMDEESGGNETDIESERSEQQLHSSMPQNKAPAPPLFGTYELPKSSQAKPQSKERKKHQHGTENFFRHKQQSSSQSDDPTPAYEHADETATHGHTCDDDPMYHTLQSVKTTLPQPGTEGSDDNDSPELPARSYSISPQKKNEILQRYESSMDEQLNEEEVSTASDSGKSSSVRTKSRTCVVM